MENEEPVQLMGPVKIAIHHDQRGLVMLDVGSRRVVLTLAGARDLALKLRQECNQVEREIGLSPLTKGHAR